MKKIYRFIPVIALALCAGCSGDEPSGPDMDNGDPINIQLTRSETQAVDAVNDFAFDFIKAIDNRVDDPNFFVSPQGVAWGMSMLANGARLGSETLNEMLRALHLDDAASMQDVNEFTAKLIEAITADNGSATVKVANAFFHKSIFSINPDFINTLNKFYKIKKFEDPTNEELDSWISDQTGGMIKDFAKNNDFENLHYGLLNNIYFEGKWEKEFDKKLTVPRKFKNSDGNSIWVQMMESHFQTSPYYKDDECRFVKFKFKNGSFSINFILPEEDKNIDDILKKIDGEKWRNIIKASAPREVEIIMPKMELNNEIALNGALMDLGVKKIFDRNNTELDGINASAPVYVNAFRQANAFSCTEEGVKAASTTGIGMMYSTGEKAPITFTLDRPFLYLITEESTGAILFAGKVSQL